MRGVSPRDPLFFLLDSTQMNREINYDQCYQTLQLKPGASLAEIKQRYRELAQRYHPDKVPPAQREHATLQFQRINAAKEAFDFLGSPEGELALAEAAIYMATAPKSNANYVAYKAAMRAAKEHGSLSPPKAILNAPTKLMEDEGYGSDYLYDHDQPDAFSGQNYFPDEFKKRPNFYDPLERGFEREIKKRLDYWAKLRAERNRRS